MWDFLKRNWKYLLRWACAVVLFLGGAVGYLYWLDSPPPDAPMGEVIQPDEIYQTNKIIAAAVATSLHSRAALLANPEQERALQETSPGFQKDTYRRDVHGKAHGCALATFTVGNVPSGYAVGLFAQPGKYDAVIRFSNGSPFVQPDQEKDVRGAAIKVLGIHGNTILPTMDGKAAQDFVLMDNPNFFIRTLEGYTRFNQLLANEGAKGAEEYFIGLRNPLTWHLRELRLGKAAQKAPPESLVTNRYWSASAYAFGPTGFAKYSLTPSEKNKAWKDWSSSKSKPLSDPNFLRLELSAQAQKGGAEFAFQVQKQVPDRNMPVEDTTVEWKESDAPFVTVAKVVLKADAEFSTPAASKRCEELSFNPWHSLPEHRPAGVMNRVRRALYEQMALFRIQKNCDQQCAQVCSPAQNESDAKVSACAECRKGCLPKVLESQPTSSAAPTVASPAVASRSVSPPAIPKP